MPDCYKASRWRRAWTLFGKYDLFIAMPNRRFNAGSTAFRGLTFSRRELWLN